MSDPRILETEIGTPTPLRASLGRGDLPEDLLRDASRRLGIVGLVGAGLWGAEIVLLHLVTSMPSLVPPDQAYLLPKSLGVYDGVFEGDSPLQILARHIQMPPEPPSRHSPFPVPPALEEIVLACLAKHPAELPASTRELADRLARCEVESPWTRDDARRWWETRGAAERPAELAGPHLSN